jgi:hypothetical protein
MTIGLDATEYLPSEELAAGGLVDGDSFAPTELTLGTGTGNAAQRWTQKVKPDEKKRPGENFGQLMAAAPTADHIAAGVKQARGGKTSDRVMELLLQQAGFRVENHKSLRKQVQSGEIEPHDYFVQTGRIYAGPIAGQEGVTLGNTGGAHLGSVGGTQNDEWDKMFPTRGSIKKLDMTPPKLALPPLKPGSADAGTAPGYNT